MHPFELPPGAVVSTLETGFSSPWGQEVTDYHMEQGAQNVQAEGAKFAWYPWNYPEPQQIGNRSEVAKEEEIQRLREKVRTSTIEAKNGKPNLQVSTLLQGGTPPAPVAPPT